MLVLASCGGGSTPGGDAGEDASPPVDACVGCEQSACEQAGCLPHQRCEPTSGGTLVCVAESCEPGYEWLGSGCSPIGGATCTGAGSIADECLELHRACVQDGDGAHCGDCDAGYVVAGSVCREGEECLAAGCALMNRTCSVVGGVASCDACRAGYVDTDDVCEPSSCDVCLSEHRVCDDTGASLACGACEGGYAEDESLVCWPILTCEALACDAQHRPCVMDPTPRCEESCEAGWVWDGSLEACRAPLACADLECEAGRPCVEGPPGQDASCGCPAGEGWDSTFGAAGGCRPCGPGGIQSADVCSGAGEQLRLVNADGVNGGACFCMTLEGFFPNASNRAEACDLDGDGWVTSAARGVLEDVRTNVSENARCDLRRVDTIAFVPDGEPMTEAALDAPLPLYESPRNDGAPSVAHPPYGFSSTSPVPAEQLNSLTKACNVLQGDYNDNAIFDVQEAQGMEPGEPISTSLRPYYREYTKFSYFLELHEGFFVAASSPDEPGTYVIRERPRFDAGPRQIGLEHPAMAPSPETEPYWRECARHDDALYSGTPPSLVGADFRGRGMHHHSQFRCVVGTTATTYNSGNMEAEVLPWRVAQTEEPGVAGWREAESFRDGLGRANDCQLTGAAYQASGADSTNPSFPVVECAPGALAGDGTRAQWIVVDYLNAGPSESAPAMPEYLRGCINECAELGVEACPTYSGSTAGFICDHSAPGDFGRIECGCSLNHSGIETSCALGCPNSGAAVHRFSSPDMTVFERSGYWMCVDPAASSAGQLEGGGFRLRGGVVAGGASGAALRAESAGGELLYQVTGRARLEVQASP